MRGGKRCRRCINCSKEEDNQNETLSLKKVKHLESERGEEPLVLARGVLLLEDGLDLLLGVLALRRLLEGVLGDGTLEAL